MYYITWNAYPSRNRGFPGLVALDSLGCNAVDLFANADVYLELARKTGGEIPDDADDSNHDR